jgi:hypothetical protein
MATSQTIVSADGNHKAVIVTAADNYVFYRQIGAWVSTYRKVKSSFLFITWDDWVGEITPASISITYLSAPDPFNGNTVTRSAFARSSPGGYAAGHYLWSVGISISMDASASVSGLPDPSTTSIGANAPALPVQSVRASANVTFPTGQQVILTAENRF